MTLSTVAPKRANGPKAAGDIPLIEAEEPPPARRTDRSGDRIVVASNLGAGRAFDPAIGDFSVAYADQNERDHRAFTAAVKTGARLAETGL